MFRLKKHYFDGIDMQGNAVIIYDAVLELFGIPIPYSSIILSRGKRTAEWRHFSRIGRVNNRIYHDQLNFCGLWRPLLQAETWVLPTERKQRLVWHCDMPKAAFDLDFGQLHLQGLGYAETLELNFAPWKLPLSELRWGRFLSPMHSVVWIEWRGSRPLKRMLWNGQLLTDFKVDDTGVSVPAENLSLSFQQPIIIKDEPLLNIANGLKWLRFLFKQQFLQTREIKWKSKAEIHVNRQTEQGFALYESVLWKK